MGASVRWWAALSVVSGLLVSAGSPPVAAKGEGPQAIAISPDGARLYVARAVMQHSRLLYTLSVIDTATLQVVATLQPNGSVAGMAISPDGSRLYLSSGGGVEVLDTVACQVIATVKTDPDLTLGALAVTPDGRRLYAAETDYTVPRELKPLRYNGGLLVISPTARKVVARVDLGRETFGVAVSPNSQRIYVSTGDWQAGRASGDVSVIDAVTGHEVAAIPVSSYVGSVTASPDGNWLYVWAPGIELVDLSAGRRVGLLPVGGVPAGFALNADGTRLYTALSDGAAVSVVDTRSRTRIGSAKVGKYPVLLAVSPDGRRVYVAHQGSDTLSVIDATSMALETTVKMTQ